MTKDEVLKLALEALLHVYHEDEAHPKTLQAINAIKEALAQPEQEPLAIVDANDEGYWADILPDRNVKVGQLLYTTPPQRTWVGLTDEEIAKEFYKFEAAGAWYQFARAIEAKLKELNS